MSEVRPVGTEYEIVTTCVDPATEKEAVVVMKYRVVEHLLHNDGLIERIEPMGKPEPASSKVSTSVENAYLVEREEAKEIEESEKEWHQMQHMKDITYSQIENCKIRSDVAMEHEAFSAASDESRIILGLIEAYFDLLHHVSEYED